MNPDAFIPFYGADFFGAVKGHPDHVALGYLKAIWYYWNHTHAQGLKDDVNFLRKVCEIEESKWEESFPVIFDNEQFFTLGENGLWHQVRAAEEWDKAKTKYDKAVARGKPASKARWK